MQDSGLTLLQQLERTLATAERTGRKDRIQKIQAEMAVPSFPSPLGYLWTAYDRLRRRKSSGASGPNPIEWPDIAAFIQASARNIAPWEISLIEDLDDIYLAEAYRNRGGGKVGAANAGGLKSITAGLGDKRTVAREKK